MDQEALKKLYSDIIACRKCQGDKKTAKLFLGGPIPAAIGSNFVRKRILLIAQNPGDLGLKAKNIDEFNAARVSGYKNWSWSEFNRKTIQDIREWRMYKWLVEAGIDYDDCAFVELYKCSFKRNKHFDQAADNCEKFTIGELSALQPKVIITIGDRAYRFVERIKVSLKNKPKILRLEHTSHRHPEKHDKTYHGLDTIRKEIENLQ